MPIKIKYLEDGKGIEYFVTGKLTGKEIIEANRKVYNKKILSNLMYEIVDRTNCTEYLVRGDDMQIIAEQEKEAAKINPHMIIALIAPSKIQYAMSRMFQSYVETQASGFKTSIFKDRESAETWIKDQLKSQSDKKR